MLQLENCVKKFDNIILKELCDVNVYCWVAGGAIRDYFSSIPIKTDIDLFFPNQDEFDKALKYFKSKKVEIKWESDNGVKLVYNKITFDLVKKFFSSPQATIDMFDFTTSMFAVDVNDVYFGETSFIDLAKKQLMINKIIYPASTLSRAFRYQRKGYNLCLGEMKKIIEAIQDMPKVDKDDDSEEEDYSSGEGIFSGID